MDRETLVNYIVTELGKNVPRNDIILELCEQMGVKWEQAERFVDNVEREHEEQIVERKTPLMYIASVLFIFMGAAVMVAIAYLTLTGYIIYISNIPIPYLGNAAIFFGGLILALGGVTGFIRVKLEGE